MVTTGFTQRSDKFAQWQNFSGEPARADLIVKKFVLGALGLVGFLLAGCQSAPVSPPLSDPFANANPPRPNVNDTYTYRLYDGYYKQVQGQVSYRVDKVDGNSVIVAVTPDTPRAGVARSEIYTSDGNWVRHALFNHLELIDYEFAPAYPAYVFPLAPGKSWSTRVNATNPVKGSRSVRVDGKVVGAERIRVAAGEFDTIKIRRDVYAGDAPETHITKFEWYAPALGRAVRTESSSQWRDPNCDMWFCAMQRGDWDIYELASFSGPSRP